MDRMDMGSCLREVFIARGEDRVMFLSEWRSKQLLRKHRIPVIEDVLVRSEDKVEGACDAAGYPCILKVSSPDILHKTEAGVVAEVREQSEAREVFRMLWKRARKATAKGQIEGVLVEPKANGLELIVGIQDDPTFGHVLMVGIGGIFVSVFNDVSFRAIPVSRKDCVDMLEDLKFKKILKGFRGIHVNREAIVDVLMKVGRLPGRMRFKELDINPLFVDEKRAIAVDALIRV